MVSRPGNRFGFAKSGRIGIRGVICLTNHLGGGNSKPRKGESSLKFLVIRPSNPSEPRDKVAPHGKSYAWILVLQSFDKLRKVGVFSYLI